MIRGLVIIKSLNKKERCLLCVVKSKKKSFIELKVVREGQDTVLMM